MKAMKILVAVESSPSVVVAHVAARPWPAGTSFEVLSVADSSEPEDSRTRQMTAIAENGARELSARGLEASAFVMHGHPKAAIVDRAGEIAADMIVIGSLHSGGLARFLLGGVASAVLRHAHCSVEVVRDGQEWKDGMKILLATDDSEYSLAAARSVAKRPWPAGTEVRVLTVVELSLTPLESALEPPYLNSEMIQMQREAAMKRAGHAIQSAEEVLRAGGLETSESISVLVEKPQQIILDEAAQWGADLIVVGSHGRRGLERFLLGSVSEAVATHAPCSVEVVRTLVTL